MIEVFRTNVNTVGEAANILASIRLYYPQYISNFDLHDRDRILRVLSHNGPVVVDHIVTLVRELGFFAEVLEDEDVPSQGRVMSDQK